MVEDGGETIPVGVLIYNEDIFCVIYPSFRKKHKFPTPSNNLVLSGSSVPEIKILAENLPIRSVNK